MKFIFKKEFLWFAILFLALILRIYGLGLSPIGLMHDDELHEIINAKSLALTGQHAPGRVAGILTRGDECTGNCIYGELGSYIFIPWMWFFPLHIFWSKLPFVLASVGIVYFTGRLFENITKSSRIGLLVALSVAINPWAIHFGRTAYFTTFSYLFYILGAYLYTRPASYKSNLILGTVASIAGSLFYFGTKPIFLFIFLWGLAYNFFRYHSSYLRFTLITCLVVSILIGTYYIILSNSYAGKRLKEINAASVAEIKGRVDEQRQRSLEIPIIRDLLINKYTVAGQIRVKSYLEFFSPIFLFLKSTGSTGNYYISNHGYFYLLDFPFLIFGIMALGLRLRNGLLILSLILIAIIPAAIKTTGDTVYALRAALAYPLLSGVIALGIYFIYSKISSNFKFARLFIVIIAFGYITSLIYFLSMYWYRTPIDESMGWNHHKRILASYLQRLREENNQEVVVVTLQPKDTFNTHVFYSGLYNQRNTILEINNVYRSGKYQYRGIIFLNNCQLLTSDDLKQKVIFVELGVKCDIEQSNTPKIANPRDGGGIYNIINDTLCSTYAKNRYPYPRTLDEFQVEKLSKEEFCHLWITNPDQI